jgi:hypothetical protein
LNADPEFAFANGKGFVLDFGVVLVGSKRRMGSERRKGVDGWVLNLGLSDEWPGITRFP